MTIRIGLVGHAGVGKDTFASMLESALTIPGDDLSGREPEFLAERRGFADPIRETAVRLGFLIDREHKEVPVNWSSSFLDVQLLELKRAYSQNEELAQVFPELKGALYSLLDHKKLSPRTFMQTLGEEFRKASPDFWIRVLANRPVDCAVQIITDVRHSNEADICDSLILLTRAGNAPVSDHISEQFARDVQCDGHPKLSYVVRNDQGLPELLGAALYAAVGLFNNQGAAQ